MEYYHGVCRCCLAKGSFKRLEREYQWLGDREIYIVMMQECFGLSVAGGDESERLICEVCITRLRDASNFKKQVIVSEKYFQMSVDDSSNQELMEFPKPMLSPGNVKKEELDDDYNSAADDTAFEYDVPVKVEDAKPEPCEKEPVRITVRVNSKKRQTRKKTKKNEASTSNTSVQPDKIGGRRHKALRKEHTDEKVKFTLCSETFPTDPSAIKHANDNIRQGDHRTECIERVNVKFICSECGREFKSEQGLNSHKSRRHKETYVRTYKCGFCNERFPRIYAREKHVLVVHSMQINDGRGGYPCGACDKVFKAKGRLRVHQRRMHLLERQYSCVVCDFRSFLKSGLEDHMIMHTGGKSVACAVCKKMFAREKALLLHMRIHNDDRRAVCKVCERAFVQRASLTYHMAKHHPNVSF